MASEKRDPGLHSSIGILAVTQNGVRLALQLQEGLPGSVCYVPKRHGFALAMGAAGFHRLGAAISEAWSRHDALVCIMATGIVVRQIAPLIKHKMVDPAVVVLDEKGQFVISLLSGHLGGANRLAHQIAEIVEGQAVITTASDVQNKPAIDLIASEIGLEMENPEMAARLTRSFLEHEMISIFDPHGVLRPYLEREKNLVWLTGNLVEEFGDRICAGAWIGGDTEEAAGSGRQEPTQREAILQPECFGSAHPCIWVSEYRPPAAMRCLFLRPRNLVVGLGCNRGTPPDEMMSLLEEIFSDENLSLLSIRNLASIDLKSDEPAILKAAETLDRPVYFYSKADLKDITVPNPSHMVETHVGVRSVCEAAALLSAQNGKLIVAKRKGANVTMAVARVDYP